MDTLVVTSLNPHAKLEYQKTCFFQWKKVGYEVKTLNNFSEREKLLNAGLDSDDIILLSESDTAQDLFGKPIPRIFPVLYRALGSGAGAILLTNSDIFPAHRKPLGDYLGKLSDSIALCRSECLELHSHRYTDSVSYRGGLDTFFFTAEALTQICEQLSNSPYAERMTFGVPGWDYYLGHFILARPGGRIMDGEVFLHQTHKTTYGHIGEFDVFASDMVTSGRYENTTPTALAAEFAHLIDSECEKTWRDSRLLKRMYYSSPASLRNPCYSNEVIEAEGFFNALLSENAIDIQLSPGLLRVFINSQLGQQSWSAAETFRSKMCPEVPALTGYLLLLLLHLVMKKLAGSLSIRNFYPEESVHGLALRQLVANYKQTELDEHVARMFAAELIDHAIFNSVIFKYITLCAMSSDALGLCRSITKVCNKDG